MRAEGFRVRLVMCLHLSRQFDVTLLLEGARFLRGVDALVVLRFAPGAFVAFDVVFVVVFLRAAGFRAAFTNSSYESWRHWE